MYLPENKPSLNVVIQGFCIVYSVIFLALLSGYRKEVLRFTTSTPIDHPPDISFSLAIPFWNATKMNWLAWATAAIRGILLAGIPYVTLHGEQ